MAKAPEDVVAMIKRLEAKFTEGIVRRDEPVLPPREWTAAEHAEATRLKRIELGLPVPSIESFLRTRRVPVKFWEFAEKPWKTHALAIVERLLRGEGMLLILGGNTGCGKSSAAAVALARRPGLWVNAPDLATPTSIAKRERDAEPVDKDEETPVSDGRMRATPLLVLDEVGLEHSPGGYAASRITATISYREVNRRPTIVTTNLSASEFKQRYGDRIGSRLNGDGLGWQTATGPDYRQVQQQLPGTPNRRGEER